MRFTYVLTSLVFYISLSAAWPWPANLFIRDATTGQLAPRQDNNDNHASSSAAPASTAASNSAAQTGSATGSASGSGSAPAATSTSGGNSNHNDNSTSSHQSSSVSITQAEVGGVSMIEPSTTTTTYYKMGQNITLVWNYTSLVVTPTAVDVLVSCASLGATYTIASNMTVNATGSVVWDTAQETTANPPPGTDKYTLAIYDAGNPAGPTQTNAPGLLGVWDQFTFAMYTPQPYTAVGDGFQCVTCNGAMSSAERQTMGVIFTMAAITVVSFTWFSSGFLSL